MTKRSFLRELRMAISHFPKHEVDKAISFYSECIEDRLDDGMTEDEAVFSMDSIKVIVRSIEESAGLNKQQESARDNDKESCSHDNDSDNCSRDDSKNTSLVKDISASVRAATAIKMRAASEKMKRTAAKLEQKKNNYKNHTTDYHDVNKSTSSEYEDGYRDVNSYSDDSSNYSSSDERNHDEYPRAKQTRSYDDYEFEPSVFDKGKNKVSEVVKKERSSAMKVFLGVTSIIWLPIAFAFLVVGLAFSFVGVAVTVAVVFSLIVIVLAFFVGGIGLAVQGLFLACSGSVHAGIATIGIGLALVGLAIMLSKPAYSATSSMVRALLNSIKRTYNKVFGRRAKV